MSLDNFILECEKDNKELEDTIKVLKNKIQRLTRENEELKSLLRGTTHCFDEEEHNKLKEEITNLSKEIDMWNSKYNDMFDENRMLKKQLENYKKLGFKYLQDKNNNLETQQKEFIDYMNKTIEELECDDVDDEEMKGYLIQRIDTFKEILQKYKEIIGGK